MSDDVNVFAVEWLTHLHSARTKEIAEITKTLSLVLDHLEVSGPAELSEDLDKVDVENAHPCHLLAVLRLLFNQRHSIPNWRSLERRTRVVFEKKGMNPSRSMKGLDVDDTRTAIGAISSQRELARLRDDLLHGQEPLGGEFEAVWDAHAGELYKGDKL